ncbi:MAG: hypothetical protein COB46_05785 [Rhodospirillaceae bacterium]|nr:MAG: hypothetical protein COB46_05785 [Rhodospirillaceae bacterium]
MSKFVGYIKVAIGVCFISWLFWLFVQNIQEADANIKVGLIGFLGMLSATLITHNQTKNREINARHFAEKREAYKLMFDLLFDLIESTKNDKKIPEKGLIKKMMEFKKALLIWGGQEIIHSWNDYEKKSEEAMSSEETLMQLESIFRAIRKDLGHDDNLLRDGSLVGLILKAEDKHMVLKN